MAIGAKHRVTIGFDQAVEAAMQRREVLIAIRGWLPACELSEEGGPAIVDFARQRGFTGLGDIVLLDAYPMGKFVAAGRQNGGGSSIARGHLQVPEGGVHVLRRFDTEIVSI